MQFFDRDFPAEMASIGMEGLQEFIGVPRQPGRYPRPAGERPRADLPVTPPRGGHSCLPRPSPARQPRRTHRPACQRAGTPHGTTREEPPHDNRRRSRSPPAVRRGWYRRNEIRVTPWLFLLPGILFFSVYVIPARYSSRSGSASTSGTGWARRPGSAPPTTSGYSPTTASSKVSFWNNIKWLILYLLAIPAGLFIALFLNQTVRGIRIYKSLFFFPFVLSQVVVGLVFSWFYLRARGC